MADNKKELTDEELEQANGGVFQTVLRGKSGIKPKIQRQVYKGTPYNKPPLDQMIVKGTFPSKKITEIENEEDEQTEAIKELLKKKDSLFL